MGTTTSSLGLYKPATSTETGWGDLVNNNWVNLDGTVSSLKSSMVLVNSSVAALSTTVVSLNSTVVSLVNKTSSPIGNFSISNITWGVVTNLTVSNLSGINYNPSGTYVSTLTVGTINITTASITNLTVSNLSGYTPPTYQATFTIGTATITTASITNLTVNALSGITLNNLFTSSGTFTAPAGITKVFVTMVAGGGGGANVNDTGGHHRNGGGGGAAIVKRIYSVTPLSSYTVVVGTGGAHGSPGSNGVNSSFDSLSVEGGKGCGTGISDVGAGGSGAGAAYPYIFAGNSGAQGGVYLGGNGGSSYFSEGGIGINGPGPTPSGYGGGGAGGGADTSAGGDGAPGFVLVEW